MTSQEGSGSTPTSNSVLPTPAPPRLDAIAKLESSSCLSQLSLTVSDTESEYFDAVGLYSFLLFYLSECKL